MVPNMQFIGRAQGGFSLVEWMVVVSLTAMLGLVTIPFTSDWGHSADCRTAASVLSFGFSKARAVAMRNPAAAAQGSAAAGMKVSLGSSQAQVYVCRGSASSTGCVSGGTSVLWTGQYRATVATTVGGATLSKTNTLTIDVDNRGTPLSGTSFNLTLGGASEVGTFY